jgi:hypothetical protein
MFGAGHSFEMISRLKANKALLRKKGYFQLKEELRKASKKESIELQKASSTQMKTIRNRMLLERKQTAQKKILQCLLLF